MISIIGILITILLFRILFWPFIHGFMDGWSDAVNGRPYKDIEEDEETE